MGAYTKAARGCTTHFGFVCPLRRDGKGSFTPGNRDSVNIRVTLVYLSRDSLGPHLITNSKERIEPRPTDS